MFKYEIFERLRAEKGVTAYQVSKATGVSTATLSNWKSHYETDGKKGYIPKADKILLLAKYFGVEVGYFVE